MSQDTEYTRHTITLIFDVPTEIAAKPRTTDALNAATSRIIELIENDQRLQSLLRRSKLEWGLSQGTWEE